MVADFGIALAVTRSAGERLTDTGLSLGTPQYMAPEQALGDRQISARADVYSLGVVQDERLAGERPFTGSTAQAVVARVLTERPRSLTAERPSVPLAVDVVVRKALEKLPADRFASAAEFALALDGQAVAAASSGDPGPRTIRSPLGAPATRSWKCTSRSRRRSSRNGVPSRRLRGFSSRPGGRGASRSASRRAPCHR